MQPQPILKDLVLIGGGHSHAIVLKQFGMKPTPGVRLTLITDVSHTPYSGMLPGYIAGAYQFDECHIDLRPLCEFAGGQMIVDRATGLDLKENRVLFANRPPIAFDVLSIDIGSTPAAVTVPGAAEYAIPVKPISQFLQRWDQVLARIEQQSSSEMRLAVVGGGAGGVELMLGLQARLRQIQQTTGGQAIPELHLFHRGDRLVPERHLRLGHQLQQVMRDRGIHLHLNETVCEIRAQTTQSPPSLFQSGKLQMGNLGGNAGLLISTPHPPTLKEIHCESGLTLPVEEIFWVTQASAASWLADSGLKTDDRGFLLVDDELRSISHPQVFAAGDVASMVNYPRPKAGVFAVRQGKPLADNLRRVLQGEEPQPFKPQKEFLILVGTGDFPEAGQSQRTAIASRGNLSFGPHPIFWKWKDSIDRRFMEKFSNLKPMMAMDTKPFAADKTAADTPPLMHCAGCGSKVGSSVLQRALSRINPSLDRSDILIGLDAPDDAAVVSVPSGQVMVQTVDYFRSLLSDPFIFGQIATNHALSDLFAMGAMPQSALAIVTLPYGSASKQEETLYQVLSGAMQMLHQANAALIGGHTIEGAELAFGLSCNGLATADQLWKKGGMQPGQALILTKPLGTGTLFAANMQLRAKGRWIEGAIASMQLSNQLAIEPLRQHNTTACTDITGFGLLGHLMEMVKASQVAIDLNLDALPILEGAKETIQQGFLSSLHPQNFGASRFVQNPPVNHPLHPLLFDPQTSGGLLASVPGDRAIDCLKALKNAGYADSQIIAQVISATPENAITPIRITR